MRDIDWADDGPVYHGPAACLHGASAGLGVALTGELVGADLLLSGQLVKPLGESRESHYTLALCRKDVLSGADPAAFINWLRAAIDADFKAIDGDRCRKQLRQVDGSHRVAQESQWTCVP